MITALSCDGIVRNLYFQPNDLTYYLSVSDPGSLYNPGDPGTFTASVGVPATPLPASWTMLLAGFVGLGFFVTGREGALPGNWTAKAEYLHVDLGSTNCGGNCGIAPTDNVSMH